MTCHPVHKPFPPLWAPPPPAEPGPPPGLGWRDFSFVAQFPIEAARGSRRTERFCRPLFGYMVEF